MKLLEIDPSPITKLDLVKQTIREFQTKKQKMGCRSATQWFIRRVPGFRPRRLEKTDEEGNTFQHVVATNGEIDIDLVPHLFSPSTKSLIKVQPPKISKSSDNDRYDVSLTK